MSNRVALYLRCSTREQSTAAQRLELERWAGAHGHTIVAVYEDHGVSGSRGRDRRPEFDRMLKDAARRQFDCVAAWSIDRLGRSLLHLVETLSELQALGVGLFLHQQGMDSSTASGKAMLQMAGVFAEFERAILIERTNAGLDRIRDRLERKGEYVSKRGNVIRRLGRPSLPSRKRTLAMDGLRDGLSVRDAARASGASIGSVHAMRKQLIAEGSLAV